MFIYYVSPGDGIADKIFTLLFFFQILDNEHTLRL